MSHNTVRSLAKNTAVNFAAQITDKILSLVLVVFLARYLGPGGFGRYSFCFAFASIFAIITNMGLNTLMIRDMARDKENAPFYLGNVILFKGALSVIMYVCLVIAINSLGVESGKVLGVYIAALYVVCISFADGFVSGFVAHEKLEYVAVMIISEKITVVLLSLALVLSGFGFLSVISAFLFAGMLRLALGALFFTRKFFKPRFSFNPALWKALIVSALPIALSQFFFGIYFRVDSVILSVLKDDRSVGWYNAAYGLVFALRFIPRPIYGAAFPVISRLYKSSVDKMKQATRLVFKYLFMLGLSFGVIGFVLAQKIVLIFYKDPYVQSIPALRVLSLTIPFIFSSYVFVMTLISVERQNMVGWIYLMITALNIGLNFLLIPRFGHMGAAYAMLVSEFICFVSFFLALRKDYYSLGFGDIVLKPAAACAGMALFLYFFREAGIILTVPASFLVYFGLLFVMRSFGGEEKAVIIKFFERA
jgi:O-antigen/teichoic acid export membrane protein